MQYGLSGMRIQLETGQAISLLNLHFQSLIEAWLCIENIT